MRRAGLSNLHFCHFPSWRNTEDLKFSKRGKRDGYCWLPFFTVEQLQVLPLTTMKGFGQLRDTSSWFSLGPFLYCLPLPSYKQQHPFTRTDKRSYITLVKFQITSRSRVARKTMTHWLKNIYNAVLSKNSRSDLVLITGMYPPFHVWMGLLLTNDEQHSTYHSIQRRRREEEGDWKELWLRPRKNPWPDMRVWAEFFLNCQGKVIGI